MPGFDEIVLRISEINRRSHSLGSPPLDRPRFYRNVPRLKPFHKGVPVGPRDGYAEVVEVFTTFSPGGGLLP